MHPRTCVSAISTFDLALDEDLAFWDRHGIGTVGVSVAKLERFGWPEGTQLVADAVGRGLRVADLIGLGPFHLFHRGRTWCETEGCWIETRRQKHERFLDVKHQRRSSWKKPQVRRTSRPTK